MGYTLVIGCNFEQYNSIGGNFTPNRFLVLDSIKERNITSSSTIASQPMQSGDTMSDHMYRNPTTYSVSGTFSLNGKNWNDDTYNFIQTGDRLTNIEAAFEKIKDDCILCQLITINDEDNPQNNSARTRFKIRNNMALENIQWVEKQNSVDFTFGFRQIIMVEAQEYENLDEAERIDLGLPNVLEPSGSSLATVISNNGQLEQLVIESLYKAGYIENEFASWLVDVGSAKFVGIASATVAAVATGVIVGVVVGVAVLKGTLTAAAAASAIFPVGTIIAAAVAVTTAVVAGLTYFFNKRKADEKRRKAFKLINGDGTESAQRLENLLDDIKIVINNTSSNITVYNFSSNEEQQVILNIAGNYYVINVIKNEAYVDHWKQWSATVTDLEGNPISTMKHDNWCPVASLSDMDVNLNCWFKDSTLQYEVYLVNPAFSEEYNGTQKEIDNVRLDLKSYTIWVSKGHIKDEANKLYKAVDKAITEQGYK